MGTKEVVGHQLENVEFKTPTIVLNKTTGAYEVSYPAKSSATSINRIRLLYYVQFDDKGKCIAYDPIIPANNYLIDLKINKNIKDTNHHSNGLIQYFTKLLEWGLDWDEFAFRDSSRPTYKFKYYLETTVKSASSEVHLAASTACNYMSAVKNFYCYYLERGYQFANPPLHHKNITINLNAGDRRMNPTRKVIVASSDLKLNVKKTRSKAEQKRPLKSLSDDEWKLVNVIIKQKKKILKKDKRGKLSIASLPIEYSYMCMLMRWSGLRRAEVATIRRSHVKNPTKQELELGDILVDIAPSSGVSTKNGSPRVVRIPALLMKQLYNYINGDRYIKRESKYKNTNQESRQSPYLFLTNTGKGFDNATLNARWSEIRNTIQKELRSEFKHKQHNLRSTFAVTRLRALINAGYKHGDALTKLQEEMGHLDPKETKAYLNQAINEKSAHHIAELVIEHLFKTYNEDFEVEV
ncbi:tyrosine-type recombinase/integrase [Vibrio splendidus]|uniref:tyrosine-type recombinase/integrase n=1 Tax=Vibrio splendidus TaxID=29497 RepID=UPI000D3394A4|nr:tyrosine-type recombinase/integrase [Vibrio splendidus]PTO62406.1 hypothetical protein CWN99_18330 [Vibrio splendidus]